MSALGDARTPVGRSVHLPVRQSDSRPANKGDFTHAEGGNGGVGIFRESTAAATVVVRSVVN